MMFERLLTTPSEEADRTKYLQQVAEREKNNAVVIDKLQSQLDTAVEVFKCLIVSICTHNHRS